MNGKVHDQILALAMLYFREFEGELLDIQILFKKGCAALARLNQHYRQVVGKSAMIPYLKRRPGKLEASVVYWSRVCRARRKIGPQAPGPRTKRKFRWVEHKPGGITRDLVFHLLRDIAHVDFYLELGRKVADANKACKALVKARMTLENTFQERAEPRAWEGGTLSFPPPPVSPYLPDSSKRALGRAWGICLRMAAIEVELMSMADRHNADPIHKGLRLVFERDRGHRYGRSLWTLNGVRLLGLAGGLAKSRARIRDEASLPDRVLRKLRIKTRERQAIALHEARRRRLAGLHRRYSTLFGGLKKTSGQAKARAARLLDKAERPFAHAI